MNFIEELVAQRAAIWHRQRAVLDGALAAKRNLTPAEEKHYDDAMANMASLAERISKLRADQRSAENAEAALAEIRGRQIGSVDYQSPIDQELNAKFREVIRTRSFEPIEIAKPESELRSGYQPGIEQRDIMTSSGSGLLGTTFFGQLQRHLVDSSAVLSAGATVLETSTGETLRVPKSSAYSSASIVTEGSVIPESDPTLGSVALGAYKYAFLLQISTELAEDAKFDVLGFLATNAGIALGNSFGLHAITGTGTGQPRGILTDASTGVTGPTGTATSFGAGQVVGQGGDLLIDLQSSLAEPYQRSRSAAWLMRGSTLAAIRKLRDSQGRYIFSQDVPLGSGAAGQILGRPVYLDPGMPAMAAGAKSVAFGDLSRYFVRSVNGIRFERSNDFAYDRDLITFRCVARLDGSLVDTSGAVKTFVHSAS